MFFAIFYTLFAAAIIMFEIVRKKRMLFDQISVLNIFYLANIVIPAALLHGLLNSNSVRLIGVHTFSLTEYLYQSCSEGQKFMLAVGSLLAYGSIIFGYRLVKLPATSQRAVTVTTNRRTRIAWLALEIVFAALMFVFGNTLVPGHPIQGLLLSPYFRAQDPFYHFQRTTLNADIYAATTTFLLVSILGYGLWAENRKARRRYLLFTIAFLLLDALAAGARRNLLIAALLIYLGIGNRSGKYKLKYILLILAISIPWLYFGKMFLRNMSDPDRVEISVSDAPLKTQIAGAAAEYGVSYVESMGTLALYTGGPRFWMDHVYTVLRMIPLGTLGFKKPWPERVVRISTAYLSGDPWMQDIPPGYLGQCWLDFPILGFIIMPLLQGLCFAWVERMFSWVNLRTSPLYLMGYLVAGYIVALPFNSGSLDYVCCPEIVLGIIIFFILHFLCTGRFVLNGTFRRLRNEAAYPTGSPTQVQNAGSG